MQSTGQTSTQLASLVPMHGSVMTYGIPLPPGCSALQRLDAAILHVAKRGGKGSFRPSNSAARSCYSTIADDVPVWGARAPPWAGTLPGWSGAGAPNQTGVANAGGGRDRGARPGRSAVVEL